MHATFGHGQVRRTVGIPGTGVYWTTVAGSSRQTHAVARRSVRRAPPADARPQLSAADNRRTAIGCLWLTGALVAVGLAAVSYGVALVPIALGIWWWVHHRHQQPGYRAQQLIKQAVASSDPAASVRLLHQAVDLDSAGPDTLLACANWFFSTECWSDAADCYAGFLHINSGPTYELAYARALNRAGHPDEAIAELEHVRALPASDNDVAALTELAYAFLLKNEPGQAEALVNTAPLQKRQLDSDLQLCLYVRSLSRFFNGQHARAIADIERLYAQNPAFPGLLETKSKMAAGTFGLDVPAPYPTWYPPQVEVQVGPELEEVSEGHPEEIKVGVLSEDGFWRWDGSQWTPTQPASEAAIGMNADQTASGATAPTSFSAGPAQAVEPHATFTAETVSSPPNSAQSAFTDTGSRPASVQASSGPAQEEPPLTDLGQLGRSNG